MKKRLVALFSAVVFAALVPCVSLAAVKAGTVIAIKGDVRVQHDGADSSVVLNSGDAVYVRDTITTGRDGRVNIGMEDDTVLALGGNTNLVIREYSIDDSSNKRNSIIGLLKGKLRTLVRRMYRAAGSKFEVHTPTAVAGVRSTDTGYTVSDDGTTRVFTLDGVTYHIVTNPDGSLTIKDYDSGRIITTLPGGEAPEVRDMTDKELDDFLGDLLPIGEDISGFRKVEEGGGDGDDDDGGGGGDAEGEGDEDDGYKWDEWERIQKIPSGGHGGGGADSSSNSTVGATF